MDKLVKVRLTVSNELGLHARASALFVQCASQFSAEIYIVKGGVKVNAKSILGVMMLALSKGSVFEVMAEGEDATAALLSLEQLVNDRFGED